MRKSKLADLINKYSISPFKLWEDKYMLDFNMIMYIYKYVVILGQLNHLSSHAPQSPGSDYIHLSPLFHTQIEA